MTYPVDLKSFWYSSDEHGTFTVGSGDYELAHRLPLEVARLFVAAPTMLQALENISRRRWADREMLDTVLEALKAAK